MKIKFQLLKYNIKYYRIMYSNNILMYHYYYYYYVLVRSHDSILYFRQDAKLGVSFT